MIDTDALKKKVLDLAIEGKLTRDFETENNIEELYQLLISENKKKKDIVPVSEDEHEGITIPNEWKWVRLGEISSIYGGKRIPAGRKLTTEDTGHKYIRVSEMKNGTVLTENLLFVPEDIYPSISKYVIGKDDIYITVAGTIGCVGKIPEEIDGANLTENADKIVFSYIDKDWLIYCLSASVVQKQIYMSTTQVAQPKLAIKRIEELAIPLPNISEQKRIARIILEMNQLIDKIDILQTQYYSNLEVLKSKIIDAGIQGKLTEQLPGDGTAEELLGQIEIQKNTILKNRKGRVDKKIKTIDGDFPYEIPSHWKWIRFGNIGLFKKGPFGSALTKSMFVPKGENTVKVYEQQHAINKDNTLGTYYITREYFDDSMSGFEVLPGDIIVSCAGTIGETYIMPDDIEQGIINQALMRVTLAEGVNRKFFQYYFDANLKKSAQNESNGSAIKNIPPFDVMKNWYFPIPPLEEQERIVEKIENILTLL